VSSDMEKAAMLPRLAGKIASADDTVPKLPSRLASF